MDDDVYKNRQDQTVTVTFPLTGGKSEALGTHRRAGARLDHHALDAAHQPGARRRARPSLRGPAGGPDAATAPHAARRSTRSRRRQLPARRGPPGRLRQGPRLRRAPRARRGDRAHLPGAELDGLSYEPLWDYFADAEKYGTENAWRFLVADYVTTTDGTGIVHQAPAYGEDDQKVCEEAGIPWSSRSTTAARFLPLLPRDVAGRSCVDANKPITQVLRAQGRLVRQASYEHSYPHCWRCRNPLIYRAVSSWFVEVTKFQDRMSELNQEINWIPGNVKDGQFGKWLANARDWSISRNRYWGSPIPVWKTDDPDYPRIDVYGSLAEIEADFGRLPLNKAGEVDLHRPFIDELTRPNPDDPTGQSTMRRVEDVLDVWFDSGSMPYRPGALPVRERGMVRHPQPGGLHRRVHRPDPRLVLHAARALHRAVRPPGLPQRHQPRHRARHRRAEDVQEPAQLPGRLRGLRPRRLRRDALVPDVAARSCAAATSSSPRRASARASARSCCRCGDVYFFTLTPNARGGPSRASGRRPATRPSGAPTRPNVLDRYLLAKTGDLVDGVTERARRLRHPAGCGQAARLRRRAHQLVRPPQPRPLLGWRREHRRLRHALHRARDGHPGRRAAAAARHRGDLARPHRRTHRAPGRLAGRGASRPRTTRSSDDGPGPRDRSARPRPAQGRRPARAPAARSADRGE